MQIVSAVLKIGLAPRNANPVQQTWTKRILKFLKNKMIRTQLLTKIQSTAAKVISF